MSPANGRFTAGQRLTFSGSLGDAGKRAVVLQSNLGRPGDVWRDVVGGHGRTTAGGRFSLHAPAPSMSGLIYRVVSGRLHTPSWTSQVRYQDVLLRAETGDPALGEGQALVGSPLTVVADTSTMPLLPGRTVTLQQRAGTGWSTLATGSLGSDGSARFAVTPAVVGTSVYRVRLEDWRTGGDRVGWFPSYPLYVDTIATRPAARPAQRTGIAPLTSDLAPRSAPFQATAGRTYRWGTQRFDFDWETGESLTSRPPIGTVRRGSWLDSSDGTGRVAMRNGAMQLSSNDEGPGRLGSHGTVSGTLQDNAQPYGRWETRVMPMVFGGGATQYQVIGELVPADPAQEHCGAQSITVFDLDAGTTGVGIAANAATGSRWSRTVPGVSVNNAFHAYGVEVTRKRITWFIDGKPVGKVTDAHAISGQPLTMRVTMQAAGAENMRTTRTLVDWVRAWPQGTGARTTGGVSLTPGTHATSC